MRRIAAAVLLIVFVGSACSGGDETAPPATTSAAKPALAGAVVAGQLTDRVCSDDAASEADVTCWFLLVPEDRSDPDGRVIRLAVTMIHSTASDPKPDPVVYLHGGPGGDAIAGASHWLDEPSLAERDLVLWDQRGAGLSDPRSTAPRSTTTSSGASRPSAPTKRSAQDGPPRIGPAASDSLPTA